jgi:serine protease Do
MTALATLRLRSLIRAAALLAVPLFVSTSLAGDSGPVGPWVKARAQEYASFLDGRSQGQGQAQAQGQGQPPAAPALGQLWRERPPASHLPAFVPPTSLAPLIRAVRPGVVNINATSNAASGGPSRGDGRSLGSGFIISPDGYVVTNNHVIERAQQIQVKLADGRVIPAQTVGRDPSTDVALLKLKGTTGELPFTYLGDSDALEVGDWVVAIGNPFGLDYSVSQGIISAKERVIGVSAFDDFLQFDAPINPGNSGGPLFNTKGEVIGVTTAIVSQGQGIGFAVPISLVKDLLPNLRLNGHLERGWLGVNIHERDVGGTQKGAVVVDVLPHSPAAQAGIQAGDRLLAVNGRPIETYLQLLRRVALVPPGHEAKLTLQRGGAVREVPVRLGARPSADSVQATVARTEGPWGLAVRELEPKLAESLRLPPYSGVLVVAVPPTGPAATAGLRSGDLITELNNRRVQDLRGLQAAVARTGPKQPALVRINRDGEERYVAVGP